MTSTRDMFGTHALGLAGDGEHTVHASRALEELRTDTSTTVPAANKLEAAQRPYTTIGRAETAR